MQPSLFECSPHKTKRAIFCRAYILCCTRIFLKKPWIIDFWCRHIMHRIRSRFACLFTCIRWFDEHYSCFLLVIYFSLPSLWSFNISFHFRYRHFSPEDGGSKFLRNFIAYLQVYIAYMASTHTMTLSTSSWQWKPQISYSSCHTPN